MSAEATSAGARVIGSGMASVGAAARLAGRRILIVEDNPFVARQVETVLTDAGCEIGDIVTTADDAVRVVLERRPLLVLMDIYLPGKRDGVDAAIEIFERCGIRSILASAPVDAATKTRAEAARPLAWLPKPFTHKKLLSTVEQAIVNIACPSLTLKSGTWDEHNRITLGPEHPRLGGSEKGAPDRLAKIASLRDPPPTLSTRALAEVWRGLVTGEGPYIRGRAHFSRTLDAEDAALCERILTDAAREVDTAVSREEPIS
jgi:two-component system, response regulator PdtaR